MKTIALILLLLNLATLVEAQVINGIVFDSATQAPLPYVHVGVRGKNLGTISRDDGTFRIDLTKAAFTDSLTFSSVGYRTQHIAQPEKTQDYLKVSLATQTYTLREVLI